MVKRSALLITCAAVGVAAEAHAQVDNSGVLDHALKQYRAAAESWQNAAHGAATTLFWSLAAISLAWTMGQLVLRRAEIGEFFAELIRYLLFTGFWAWMLANGPAHAQLIVDSMVQLASSASSQNRLTPSGVLDVGFHILDRALTQSALSSPLTSAIGIVVALVILVVLALTAINMLVSLIACWIVAYGGLIILGFGGSRWTSDMAINYYRMVLSLGLQVLAMVLLVGMGESFLRSYFNMLKQDVSLHELAVLLVVSLVLLVSVNRIPALLGTLANGSSPQYALGGGAGAGAALSAISTAAGLGAWSLASGRTAADGAGALSLGAGSLAKALAIGTASGASSAMTSLFDGFRSGSSDGSSSPPSGASGGSVLPAAAPRSTTSGTSTKAGPATASAAEASRSTQHVGTGIPQVSGSISRPGDPPQRGAKVAEQSPATTRPDAQRGNAADPRPGARGGSGGDPTARPDARRANADAARMRAAVPTDARPQDVSGAPPKASDHGKRNSADSPGKPSKTQTSDSVSRPERAGADPYRPATTGATPHAPTTGAPAGAFVHSATSANAPGVAASSWPAPSLATATTPAPAAPSSVIADAARLVASPRNIPFSTRAPNSAPRPYSKPTVPATTAEPPDRTELPAAYNQQTSVDVEAEVSAFRDRD